VNQWWSPWYRREDGIRARWRYVADGAFVPGATDVRAEDLWRPKRIDSQWIEFPGLVVRTPQFKWATNWWSSSHEGPAPTSSGGAVISAEEWDLHKDKLIGLNAPELCAQNMLTTESLAHMMGVTTKTVSAFVTRGYVPKPTVHHTRLPLWSIPVVVRSLAATRLAREAKRRPVRDRTPTTVTESLDELLMRLDLNLDEPDDFELAEM
jgi:hypothetical protein